MITKDLKKLLQKLNDHMTQALEGAVGFCISRGHYEVTTEHLLLKLMEDGSGDVPLILNHFEVNTSKLWEDLLDRLEGMKTGNSGRPSFSPLMLQVVEAAWVVGSVHHGYGEIRSGALLEAMLENDAMRATSFFDHLEDVNRDELRHNFIDIVGGSAEDKMVGRTSPRPRMDGEAGGREGETALDLYTHDVTGNARAGDIDPVFGRDTEIRQIIDILSRRRKNNPILVGEPGVGKTAVVEGLALRIAQGDVPDSLKEVEIRGLDLGLLQAGAGVKGEFEKRLKAVIEDVQQAPKPTITFIDEAHTLIGAGGAAGTSDAANMLKPALARGELRTIAATTWTEYKKYIEKDPALERRFQMVKIDEPDIENAVIMLRGIKGAYEAHHGIPISDEAARTSAEFAARYIAGRQLPDKAVDLIDTASARVRMSQSAKPPALDDAERRLDYLNIEIRSIERDLKTGVRKDSSTLEELHAERDELEEKVAAITERWEKEKDLVRQIVALRQQLGENGQAAPELVNGEGEAVATEEVAATEGDAAGEVMADPPSGDGAPDDPEAIKAELAALKQELDELQDDDPLVFAEVNAAVTAQVVSDWTGIPAGSMEKDEATVLLKLEERLQEDIIGQNEAIGLVADSIRSSKAGMRNPEAPIAVFLFVGPSGVGKTETARMLAQRLFGGQRFLTTINMSEYQEKHTVSQLKGSPPGYVGYGEGGILTEAVRQRPYSVVLLDEVEKAHRDVMNLFYQVFDKGFMRDGEGREIDFKNTIIMMTSNLASETITYMGMDEDRPSPDQLREAIHDTLAEHFQPALLARMKVVPFYPLTRGPMRQIVEIKLNQIDKRLREAHGIRFTYEEEVVDRVAERCTQVDLGARNIDFIIDKNVLPQASKALIGRMAEDEMPSSLTLGLDEEGNFTYDFDA